MSLETHHYFAGLTTLLDGDLEAEIPVCDQASLPFNQQFMDAFQESHPEPTFSTVMAVKPEITFATMALGNLLGLTGYKGYPIDLDAETRLVDLWFKRGSNLGSRDASDAAVHKRFRANKGLLYWTTLSASFQQAAVAQCRLKPVTDGTAAPIVYAADQEIPFTPDSIDDYYTLGRVKFGATVIDGNNALSLALNQEMFESGADDDLYDSMCSINALRPVITISGRHLEFFATFGEAGAASVSGLTIFLRRKKKNGGHWANGDSKHIRIVFLYPHWVVNDISGGLNQPAGTTYQIRPTTYSVAEDIMTITLNTTIS